MTITKPKNLIVVACILFIGILAVIFWPSINFNKKDVTDQNNKSSNAIEETVFPLPRFSDYYTNLGDDLVKPVAINYNSNPEIDKYKQSLENIIIPDTNFAFSYRLFTIGCGTACHEIIVIDSSNGNIYFPKIYSRLGMDFDSYSKLLVTDPPKYIYETYGNDIKNWEDAETNFYVWENNNFKLIRTAKINYKIDDATVSYNQVMSSKLGLYQPPDFYNSGYEGQTIKWQGKISTYYSQITGIKFCVVDQEHQGVDINNPCDWFWATSNNLMDADDTSINPGWDGQWVNYILKYYKVPFDENTKFYNEVYNITGVINGIDCGVDNKCIPDIDIISITK